MKKTTIALLLGVTIFTATNTTAYASENEGTIKDKIVSMFENVAKGEEVEEVTEGNNYIEGIANKIIDSVDSESLENIELSTEEQAIISNIEQTLDNADLTNVENINAFVGDNVGLINTLLDNTEVEVGALNEMTSDLNEYILYKQEMKEIPSMQDIYAIYNGEKTFEEIKQYNDTQNYKKVEFDKLSLMEKVKNYDYKKLAYTIDNLFFADKKVNDNKGLIPNMQAIISQTIKGIAIISIGFMILIYFKKRASTQFERHQIKRIRATKW